MRRGFWSHMMGRPIADVVGVYLNLPDQVIVLSIDEPTSRRALERTG